VKYPVAVRTQGYAFPLCLTYRHSITTSFGESINRLFGFFNNVMEVDHRRMLYPAVRTFLFCLVLVPLLTFADFAKLCLVDVGLPVFLIPSP